ncbi:MAG: hypothetical protein Q7V58_07290 [Actinomycetota bacterium]|nr:hypothetical protein [Actinomycetota bacterium]
MTRPRDWTWRPDSAPAQYPDDFLPRYLTAAQTDEAGGSLRTQARVAQDRLRVLNELVHRPWGVRAHDVMLHRIQPLAGLIEAHPDWQERRDD